MLFEILQVLVLKIVFIFTIEDVSKTGNNSTPLIRVTMIYKT